MAYDIISGDAARQAPLARLDHDLRADAGLNSRVDPRLFDPRLADLYEEAAVQASEAGRAEGFALGYEEGRARAEAEMHARLAATERSLMSREQAREAEHAAVIDLLRAAVASFEERSVEAYVQASRELGTAAFHIAEALVGRELAMAEDALLDAVSRVAASAPKGAPVTLWANPADLPRLEERREQIASVLGRETTFRADSSLAPGDLVADSGASRIDVRVGAALERVAEALGVVRQIGEPVPAPVEVPAARGAESRSNVERRSLGSVVV